MSILHGFAEARARLATYRCDECGAQRKWEADDAPESLACWAVDGRVICTGRATRVPLPQQISAATLAKARQIIVRAETEGQS